MTFLRHLLIGLTCLSQTLALEPPLEGDPVELWTGKNVSFGGILFPHLHGLVVVGDATEDPEMLAVGGHDPSRSGVNLLALEPAMSLRLGDHIEGFVVASYLTDATGHLTGGTEEAFLKLVDLPGNFELRGGRYFNRFGFQNALHNHAWDQLDQPLALSRLLQEGELTTIGGELTWHFPTSFPMALSLSFGEPPAGHGHGHGEEEDHHDDEEDDHHDDEEHHLEAEEANFEDTIFAAHLIGRYHYNDFHQLTGTVSYALGENGFGENTHLAGLGLEYQWRENGLGAGGRSLRWRNELLWRRIETLDEDGDSGSHDEIGAYSTLLYGLNSNLEAALRLGFVSGAEALELSDRWRASPSLTWVANQERTLYARLQYNYDHDSGFGDSHGLWFGLGFNFGGAEIR